VLFTEAPQFRRAASITGTRHQQGNRSSEADVPPWQDSTERVAWTKARWFSLQNRLLASFALGFRPVPFFLDIVLQA
jgi:hypothetical protein